MKNFINFSTGTQANIFSGVSKFYVSPYQLCGYGLLSLTPEEIRSKGTLDVNQAGHPVAFMPIDWLKINNCLLKLNDDCQSGSISYAVGAKTTRKIYFRIEDDTMCITTVLHQHIWC
jgi:hypothetical protein